MTRFDALYSRFVREYAYPRQLRSYKIGAFPDAVVFRDGRKLIDFSSNDYLGLAKHPYLIARSHEFAKRFGTGASSSRLVRGNIAAYDQIETQLAHALNKETALILATGYQANATILAALLDTHVLQHEPLVFCDKASHASIYAGLTHLRKFHRFQHNNLDHLERLLNKYSNSSQSKFIIAESVYSMDGDQADLKRLTELARHYQAALYIDDAHAVGLYGATGWGMAAEWSHGIDIIMGTFSKAFGSFGAYIACSQTLREYLIHSCKGLIYSTALAPPILGAISAAIELLPTFTQQRQQVQHYAQQIRTFFDQNQLSYGLSNTHIVPWIIGNAEKTRLISQHLEEQGILGTAIQPPTVSAGKSRIRLCVSYLHTEKDLELLFTSIQKVKHLLEI